MLNESAIIRIVAPLLCLLLTSCTCGQEFTQSWSFPAKPSYGDVVISANDKSPEAYDQELRKILHVTNLEDAYIGCTTKKNDADGEVSCSEKLDYYPGMTVRYTFVRELNPKSCRFMSALDKVHRDNTQSSLTATIKTYDEKQMRVMATCPAPSGPLCTQTAPVCTLNLRCTKPTSYPACAKSCVTLMNDYHK